MYIEYITPQRIADPNITKYKSKGGDYRPTWLIRTSDWEKVPGHEAINGYHTLSYCWEQSGEVIPKDNGDAICIDNGHHRVTKIVKEKRHISNLLRHRDKSTVTCQVTYNELLQQICMDFDIEYLWYDKICIDKTDIHRRDLHRIYGNARYTVAIVPEVNIDNPKDFDTKDYSFNQQTKAKTTASFQMWKSPWLEHQWPEVMMSTQLLIVGRNTHFWALAIHKQGEKIKEFDELSARMLGFQERKLKSANQVLSFAHRWSSTKEHDTIFRLANIFHDTISFDIEYDNDFSTVMSSFYRQLGQHDLSIMCFGSNIQPWNGEPQRTMGFMYDLPTWTGVAGAHSGRAIANVIIDGGSAYDIDDHMVLHMRCRSSPVRPIKYDDYVTVSRIDDRTERALINCHKQINSMDDFDGNKTAAVDWSEWNMTAMQTLIPTHYSMPDAASCSPVMSLSLTEECDECIMLGILFSSVVEIDNCSKYVEYMYSYLSPIVKKSIDGTTYKVIGVIHLNSFLHNEPRKSPVEFLEEMFDQLGCSEYQDFLIK